MNGVRVPAEKKHSNFQMVDFLTIRIRYLVNDFPEDIKKTITTKFFEAAQQYLKEEYQDEGPLLFQEFQAGSKPVNFKGYAGKRFQP